MRSNINKFVHIFFGRIHKRIDFSYFELGLLFSLLYIYLVFTFRISTDIASHAYFVKNFVAGQEPFQIHFLYFLLIHILSFFSGKLLYLLFASIITLTAATLFKYYIVKNIVKSEISIYANKDNLNIFSAIFSAVMLVIFSLPSLTLLSNYYYLGNYPPNVWHNSTTILVMPFAILLFWLSAKQHKEFKQNRNVLIIVLLIINAIIKPSFLFVFVVVYPFMIILKQGYNKSFLQKLFPTFIGLALILMEYFLIFIINNGQDKSNSITINFFQFLNTRFTHGKTALTLIYFIISLISSFLFPIVLIIRHKKFRNNFLIQYAIYCLILALMISAVLAETGSRASHGNFLWQSIICSFILFLICMIELSKEILINVNYIKKYWLELIVMGLHFISGCVYLTRALIFKNCY